MENRENRGGGVNPCQGKHREFGNFAKNTGEAQGIWFAQVVKFPDSKGKIDFRREKFQISFEAG